MFILPDDICSHTNSIAYLYKLCGTSSCKSICKSISKICKLKPNFVSRHKALSTSTKRIFDCVVQNRTTYRHTGMSGLWTQVLDTGLWTLNVRPCTLDSGRWNLNHGLQKLDSRHWALDAGLWMQDSGLWTVDAGPGTLECGLWTINF